MLISEERVQVLIKKYVPEKYWANPDTGPIREFMVIAKDQLVELASKLIRKEVKNCQGLSIDVAELMQKPEKNNFVIVVSDDILLEDHMIFVLLHEVGHVDWHFNEESKKFSDDEHELYADFFAFDTLKDILGMDRAFELLLRYCSMDGIGKEILKHDVE